MKLKTSVVIAGLLLFAAFGAQSVALMATTDLLDSQSRELARAGESIRVAQSLKNRLLVHVRNDLLHELDEGPVRSSRQSQREEIEALLHEAELFINNEEEKLVFGKVAKEMQAYLHRREQLDNRSAPLGNNYHVASADVDNSIAVVDQLVEVNRDQMSQLSMSIAAQNTRADYIALGLFAFGGVILGGVAFAVFRSLARPLTELARVITTYGTGGADTRIESSGVTEIQTVMSNFTSMTERLEEKRKDQLQFIASIAHDLRNPLNSMCLSTELLLRQDPGKNRRILDALFRQARHLDRLVSDLLDTTHIESGHLQLNLSLQDVGVLIQDAVDLHRTTSGLHAFETELAEHLSCHCDSARLSQVLNNLLSNAIKYSPHGGLIAVRAWVDGGTILISVSDQGIGINPEDRESIFTPFQRTTATKGTILGIGLGLSTSRRIVEAHGGKLTVISEPGKGSTFRITIPKTVKAYRTAGS